MTCALMGLGPGSWRGHSVHPGWSLTSAEGPGESELWGSFLAARWEASVLHHPCPPIFQTRLWYAPCGLSQGRPSVPWLQLGGGVSACVPWVCVGISSRLRENLLHFPVRAVEMVSGY